MDCLNTLRNSCRMQTWYELAKARMSDLRITQEQMAERLGVTQGAVGHWLSGKREPGLAMINALLAEVGVPPLSIQHAESQGNVSATMQPYRASKEYPLISWVAAGMWQESCDNFHPGDADLWLSSHEMAGPHGYWLEIDGESMIPPSGRGFPPGELVLVQPEGFDLISGKLYIAKLMTTGETTFKQYVRDAGIEYLRPFNPAFKTMEIDERVRIIGRVIDSKPPRSMF